jgi:hypothetical protein
MMGIVMMDVYQAGTIIHVRVHVTKVANIKYVIDSQLNVAMVVKMNIKANFVKWVSQLLRFLRFAATKK